MFYRSLLIEVVRQKVEMELANKNKILSGEEIIIVSIYIYILELGKRFECSNLRLLAMHSKLHFSLQSFAATPTLIFADVHLYKSKHVINVCTCMYNYV